MTISRLRQRLATLHGPLGALLRAAQMFSVYKNPFAAVSNRLRISTRTAPATYHLKGGIDLLVDPGPHDVRVINEVWIDRIYELEPTAVPQPGWVVFDVGAHKGTFSLRAAHLMNSGTIHAFEPDSRNFSFLTRNISQQEAVNIHARNVALGAKSRKGSLYLRGDQSGQHSLYAGRFKADEETKESEVQVLTLSEVLNDAAYDVDLMKLDVEGAEYEIILDSAVGSFDRIRRVVLEYDRSDPRDATRGVAELEQKLSDLGYRIRNIPERALLWGIREG